jgi:hypothetical protein
MAYVVLSDKGKILIRKSVWGLSDDDLSNPVILATITALDESIKKLVDNKEYHDLPLPADDLFNTSDDVSALSLDPDLTSLEYHDVTPEELDEYLTAELLLPQGGELVRARVVKRKRDGDGIPVGKRNSNPILDTRQYDVEFPDGSLDTFTANTIAENLYSQVDQEGRPHVIFKAITDHRTDDRVARGDNATFLDKNGVYRPRLTTLGWELLVEWADGTSSWLPLKDLKDSNPLETAEYAVANRIADEPAFVYWVRHVLRKRDRFIKKVKTRYWKRTHKFGIEMPKSVKDALAIDERSGTNFWRLAIEKEMRNVMPAFEFKNDDIVPIGYKRIDCHMIFDIKTDLTRKARLVAGGHQTDVPDESVYSSVVSRDSVRIAFTIAALNDLEVLAADVQNAYLNAPTNERC